MKPNNLTMTFVGDLSFSDLLFCQGYGVRSVVNRKGVDFLFSRVKHFFINSDISFGNLETILSDYGEDEKSLQSVDMRGTPECANALKDAGFTLVNMANNHAMQHGTEAFNETVQLLRSNGIQQVGIKSEDNNWHSLPVLIEKRGIRVGFLGYSFEVDRYHPSPLYCYGEDEAIIEDIIRLKNDVDFLVLSVHWGLENINRPSIITIQRAHKYIDAGADAVIGHHPHVVQGLEEYNGKIIAYSLGNFIFDMNWSKVFREAVILKVNVTNRNNFNFEIVPVFIDNYCRPIPLDDKESMEFKQKVDNLSELIRREIEGDLEKKSMKYYNEVEKEIRRHRYLSYAFFLKNFHKYNKKYFFRQLRMTINSRVEDLGG